MNILFFLTPKCDVAFVEENDSLRNALEKMEYHRYSAIPVLSKDGRFVGTLTEGDLLFEIKNQLQLDLREAERVRVKDIAMKNHYDPVGVSSSMESLVKLALTQNFVPVVDDLEHFIGIVRRRELMNYLYQHQSFSDREEEPTRILRQRAQISTLYTDWRPARRYAVAD